MVTLYSKNNCIQCKMTKRFLADQGIDFKEINIEEDQSAIDWLKAQGFRSAPVVISPAATIVGFRPNELKSLAV